MNSESVSEMKNIFKLFVPYRNINQQWPQILSIFIACISGFTLGLHFNWISPSIPILTSNSSHITPPMTLEETSYFTVISPLAAIITGPIFAIVVDAIGRKKTVMLIAIPQMVSFILIALAEDLLTFYIARFISGIGDAVFYNSLPIYVGEISEPNVRGLWGNLVAISVYFGGFIINVIGAYCDIKTTAYICLVFPVIQLLTAAFLPESPYYLLMKSKNEEAKISLQTLRWREDVDDELITLTNDVKRQVSESGTFKDLFTISTNRKALLIAIGIRATQLFSGLPAFTIYTQYMFNQAGSSISASTSAIIFTGVLTVVMSCAAFLVSNFGRRTLMIFSSTGCGITITTVAIYFFIYEETNLDISSSTWIPLGGLLAYILLCSTGLGILPTLMLGELFSASIKGKALYVMNIFFSLCILSISKIFQSLSYNFGMYAPFCLFSFSCLISVMFSYYFVPETKGKTLEEIQQNLKRIKSQEVVSK